MDDTLRIDDPCTGKIGIAPEPRTYGHLDDKWGEFNRSMQHHLDLVISLKVVFMAQGKKVEVSAAQRADIWRRWKAGESLHEIGRAHGRKHTSIHLLLSHHGGIVPAARRRSPRTLTLSEREDISRWIASGSSIREIATRLSRTASTVKIGRAHV